MEKIPVRHIHAMKEPAFSGNFIIRDIRELLAGDDMVQPLHRHDFFYLLALKKGAGTHEIDFTSYPVCDNSVFFMRPGQVHQLTLRSESAGYLMQFSRERYTHDKLSNQLLRKTSNINYYQFDAVRFKQLFAVLTAISREYAGKQERYQEVISANMIIFFIELIRGSSTSDKAGLYAQEQLEDFLELLEQHIFDHKPVSEYAAMMNLSPYQLNAITKSTLGKTCSELMNESIILEAKRYLLATSDQVNQIAYHLGYEDVSYFIRFFRKHTGHTPEAFRQNFR